MNGVERMIYMQSINANDGTHEARACRSRSARTSTSINVLVQNRVSQAHAVPARGRRTNYGVNVKKSSPSRSCCDALLAATARYDSNVPRQLRHHQHQRRSSPASTASARCAASAASDYSMRDLGASPTARQPGAHRRRPRERGAASRTSSIPPARSAPSRRPTGQEFTYTVRAKGRLITAEEFGDIIVRANPDGSVVRLKRRGPHRAGIEIYNAVGPLNGKPGAVIAIYQIPGSNALEVAKRRRASDGGAARRASRRTSSSR